MKFKLIYIPVSICLICFGCGKKNSTNNISEVSLSEILSQTMFIQLESEGCKLNLEVNYSDSLNLDLHNVLQQLPKLVFFHSELNCNSCVEQDFPLFNKIQKTIENNLLFFASYKNNRDLIIFKRINNIQSNIYNVSSVGLPVEELNMPFCFVINQDFRAESVFIPIKEDSLLLKRYLEIIANKYFKK
ncbi:MAG: hypothetical protein LBH32_12665 [Dysgonamonadaceae bacterium]|jgi:hypothetical protein|nr:hypothetical protein [Dysgonamonadaceae bacterium]